MQTPRYATLGMSLIILSFIMPLIGAISVPFLHFSTTTTVIYSFVMIFGMPELIFFIGVALVGKEAVTQLKHKAISAWYWLMGKKI